MYSYNVWKRSGLLCSMLLIIKTVDDLDDLIFGTLQESSASLRENPENRELIIAAKSKVKSPDFFLRSSICTVYYYATTTVLSRLSVVVVLISYDHMV